MGWCCAVDLHAIDPCPDVVEVVCQRLGKGVDRNDHGQNKERDHHTVFNGRDSVFVAKELANHACFSRVDLPTVLPNNPTLRSLDCSTIRVTSGHERTDRDGRAVRKASN